MSNTAPTTRRTDDAPIRFGVIGAGFIARWFAEAVARSESFLTWCGVLEDP